VSSQKSEISPLSHQSPGGTVKATAHLQPASSEGRPWSSPSCLTHWIWGVSHTPSIPGQDGLWWLCHKATRELPQMPGNHTDINPTQPQGRDSSGQLRLRRERTFRPRNMSCFSRQTPLPLRAGGWYTKVTDPLDPPSAFVMKGQIMPSIC
jgi:hypothetical protein